jgi:hypothetical protein
MHRRAESWVLAACVAAAVPFVSSAAADEPAEGSTDIVCAVIDVVACAEEGACIQGRAKDFDLHQMFIVDVEKKVVHSTRESENKAVSPVKNLETSGGHLIVQGVENSRGWSIAIDTATGKMSASGVGDALSFLVFGTCTTN